MNEAISKYFRVFCIRALIYFTEREEIEHSNGRSQPPSFAPFTFDRRWRRFLGKETQIGGRRGEIARKKGSPLSLLLPRQWGRIYRQLQRLKAFFSSEAPSSLPCPCSGIWMHRDAGVERQRGEKWRWWRRETGQKRG